MIPLFELNKVLAGECIESRNDIFKVGYSYSKVVAFQGCIEEFIQMVSCNLINSHIIRFLMSNTTNAAIVV
jgi:hypothetical protein